MGANQGRTKGNKQKAEYEESGRKAWKQAREKEENQRSESGNGHRESKSVLAEPGREGKEKQKAE